MGSLHLRCGDPFGGCVLVRETWGTGRLDTAVLALLRTPTSNASDDSALGDQRRRPWLVSSIFQLISRARSWGALGMKVFSNLVNSDLIEQAEWPSSVQGESEWTV